MNNMNNFSFPNNFPNNVTYTNKQSILAQYNQNSHQNIPIIPSIPIIPNLSEYIKNMNPYTGVPYSIDYNLYHKNKIDPFNKNDYSISSIFNQENVNLFENIPRYTNTKTRLEEPNCQDIEYNINKKIDWNRRLFIENLERQYKETLAQISNINLNSGQPLYKPIFNDIHSKSRNNIEQLSNTKTTKYNKFDFRMI